MLERVREFFRRIDEKNNREAFELQNQPQQIQISLEARVIKLEDTVKAMSFYLDGVTHKLNQNQRKINTLLKESATGRKYHVK